MPVRTQSSSSASMVTASVSRRQTAASGAATISHVDQQRAEPVPRAVQRRREHVRVEEGADGQEAERPAGRYTASGRTITQSNSSTRPVRDWRLTGNSPVTPKPAASYVARASGSRGIPS